MNRYSRVNAVGTVERQLGLAGEDWWILRGIYVEKRWTAAGKDEGLVERSGLLAGECGRSDLDDSFSVSPELCIRG